MSTVKGAPTASTIVFAEDDTLFRLMEAVVSRHISDRTRATLKYFFGERMEEGAEKLLQLGPSLGIDPDTQCVVVDEPRNLASALPVASVLVTENEPVTDDILRQLAGHCRLVQKFGRDVRNIDLASASRHGVPVANLNRVSSQSAADHAMCLILALSRRLLFADGQVRRQKDAADLAPDGEQGKARTAFNWANIDNIRNLNELTIGFLGFGENSGAVAMRAQAFGMKVRYNKRRRLDAAEEQRLGVAWAERDELLAASDVLSMHLPYSAETDSTVDASFLRSMKPGAILINTARGGLVDEDALCASLMEGHLAGAGLDVSRYEPIPANSPLLKCGEKVVLTPHMAGGEPEFMLREAEDVLRNAMRAIRGEIPEGLVS